MKLLCVISFFCLLLSGCSTNIDKVVVSASSYVVINETTNQIMEGYNYNETRSVASISKVMTAIVCIENCDVYSYTTIPSEISKIDGSSIYLKIGERIQVIDLLYGLLLRSGNDAAISIAHATSNSVDDFVKLMNEKAKCLELKNTFFNNPHGLDEEDGGNISTALDMALIYSYCMKNPLFCQIVKTKQYKTFTNKNKLLQSYQYCNGGKTGYTKNAKRTLISSAYKDNISLIVVTLNCGDDFSSHKSIYEHYFSTHKAIVALKKGYNEIGLVKINSPHEYCFVTKEDGLSLFYSFSSTTYVVTIELKKDDKVIDKIVIKDLNKNNISFY